MKGEKEMTDEIKKAFDGLGDVKKFWLYNVYEDGLAEKIPFFADDISTAVRMAPSLWRKGEIPIKYWVAEKRD